MGRSSSTSISPFHSAGLCPSRVFAWRPRACTARGGITPPAITAMNSTDPRTMQPACTQPRSCLPPLLVQPSPAGSVWCYLFPIPQSLLVSMASSSAPVPGPKDYSPYSHGARWRNCRTSSSLPVQTYFTPPSSQSSRRLNHLPCLHVGLQPRLTPSLQPLPPSPTSMPQSGLTPGPRTCACGSGHDLSMLCLRHCIR